MASEISQTGANGVACNISSLIPSSQPISTNEAVVTKSW